jgi:GNAT superfamily N-acetyltransferase
LNLDPGYLSRILRSFRRNGLVERAVSASDGRRRHLSLSAAGQAAFAPVDRRSHDETASLLAALPASAQRRLVAAMDEIARLLDPGLAAASSFGLRAPLPGEIGWVVARHGALYAQEYGFDSQFEALVAEIAAAFIKQFDPRRDACWIAELDGRPAGSVFLVRDTDTEAKLRLLLVEPEARGVGIGRRLVEECVVAARAAGYRKLTLWTQSILVAARRRYEAAGFELVRQEPHRSFGRDLIGEYWELAL